MPKISDPIAAAASLSKEDRAERLKELFRIDAAARGEISVLLGEVDRSEDFRGDGATSTEAWVVECFGVSAATARSLTHVGGKAWDVPHLVGSMCAGDISFDKVRAVIDVATPETERELRDQALECTVRELADVARMSAVRGTKPDSRQQHQGRYLRFNDEHRTMNAQLPAESYAATRAWIDALAAMVPADPDTPLDQRRCDGLTAMASGPSPSTTTASPYFVVVHAPMEALVAESGDTTELAGDLERDGLIDCETVQRIACDATIAVAVDDDVGHTMYEGRAKRFPTHAQRREVTRRDRHCRFPGCTNVTFTNVHHIVAWKPGGTTDLPNIVLLCKHHHGVVHSDGWSMSGDANGELRFVGPSGRVMASRPSVLWTRVTAGSRASRASIVDPTRPDPIREGGLPSRFRLERPTFAAPSVRRGGLMHEGHRLGTHADGPCHCGRNRVTPVDRTQRPGPAAAPSVRHTHQVSQGANRKRRRKPKRTLPPVPDYVRYSGGGRRYWRLGGPLTKDHEAAAKAAQAAKPPSRLGRLVLRMLGGGKKSPPPR